MKPQVRAALEQALGSTVSSLSRVSGGDINDGYDVRLQTGERVFVKTRDAAPPTMYLREAEGLAWLAEAGALPTPVVRCAHTRFLALSFVEGAARRSDFAGRLGRGLATLHRFEAPGFGLAQDNFIAHLPQPNAALASFADFYRVRRLEPLLSRALAAGKLEARDRQSFERLFSRLAALVPAEPPARLHGDLWSGNVHVDERGAPMLIDPAVYGGHREVDLAMLQLFGAPSPAFFSAYDEVYPRAPGASERVSLFQLYPLLVHVCLFGGSYVGQLRAAVARYL